MSRSISAPVQRCQLHTRHVPAPLWIERHHIQPLGMGGPDEADNWLWCCPTGHFNIHALMGPAANGQAMPAGGTLLERRYALAGIDKWVAAGKPGSPHAAYGITPTTEGRENHA